MWIIDRYLLRQFLTSLVIFFITFAGLFIVIDAFTNLDELIISGKENGGLLKVIFSYYGVRSLAVLDRTSGVLTLVAAMFTLTALERHNELTAIFAAGVSKWRIARPVILGVIAVTFFTLFNREMVIPRFRTQLSQNAHDLSGRHGHPVSPQYDQATEVLVSGDLVYLGQRRIENAKLILPPTLQTFDTQIHAKNAVFHEADGARPSGYLLTEVSRPASLATLSTLKLADKPVLMMPGDTPNLKPNECFLATDMRVEQLGGGRGWKQFASTVELMQGLRSPSVEYGPDVRVAVHARIVQPFLDITLLFLGLPLVLARESRNIFVAIGMCLLLVVGFFVITLTCHSLGSNLLISPALAAWSPLLLFVPVAVYVTHALQE